jgi:hypothetical protein
MKNMNRFEQPALAIIALLAWIGVGVYYCILLYRPEFSELNTFQVTLVFLNAFTVLTNLLVAMSSTIALLAPRSGPGRLFSGPKVRTAIALYILMVALIYNGMMRGGIVRVGFADIWTNEIRHVIVPALYLLFWLFVVPKGVLNWRLPLYWSTYPLVYLVWVFICGGLTGRYPYSFLDAGNLGYTKVLITSLMLTVVFLIVGEIFVGVDRLFGRKKT